MNEDPLKLELIPDEDLLGEVHRRFGDSWCAFSAGVRSLDECPVCKGNRNLTRHHLVPVATRAGQDQEVKRRYVKLCGSCHTLAHKTWGPGDAWTGPTEREVFVRDLTLLVKAE
jgi:hypothetical protein